MSGVPGLHVFEFQGRTHVYDRSGPTVLEVDDAAGVLLRCREEGMALGPALRRLEERYGGDATDGTAREYLALRRRERLRTPARREGASATRDEPLDPTAGTG